MLKLGLYTTPDLEVVDPRPDGPRHVETGRRVKGQNLSGTLLSHAGIQQTTVKIVGLLKEVPNLRSQMCQLCPLVWVIADDAVLLVGMVLETKLWYGGMTQ
jgi:hypothetical protein